MYCGNLAGGQTGVCPGQLTSGKLQVQESISAVLVLEGTFLGSLQLRLSIGSGRVSQSTSLGSQEALQEVLSASRLVPVGQTPMQASWASACEGVKNKLRSKKRVNIIRCIFKVTFSLEQFGGICNLGIWMRFGGDKLG